MATFTLTLTDMEDGSVDLGVAGYTPGDPTTAAVNFGAFLWNQAASLFKLLDALAGDEPEVEEVEE